MSDGHEKKPLKLVSLDPEEFNEVVKRVHTLLSNRAEKARVRMESRPTDRSEAMHVETAKDAFVFVHMIELIEYMSAEIHDLRTMLSSLGEQAGGEGPQLPDTFAVKKTTFLN